MIGGVFGSLYNINMKDEANAKRKELKRQQKEQEKEKAKLEKSATKKNPDIK